MDINVVRAALTVVMFAAFIAIVLWAYNSRRKGWFDSIARSILDDEDESTVARKRVGERQ
jgi:cytochrome c oxidase cbb3-type subunit 4